MGFYPSGGGGAGTIGGSTGTTDNNLLRADGGLGSTLQSSNVTLSDLNAFSVPSGASAAGGSGLAGGDGQNFTFTTGAGGNGKFLLRRPAGNLPEHPWLS